MDKNDALFRYVLRLGDSALILAQRMIEIVTHGPELEEEMANANFSLDYLGQARMFYSLAGEIEGAGRTEDDFAFQRDEREFESFLLVEQPNGHFGDTITRSVLFDEFYQLQLDALEHCSDERLAAIAARAAAGAVHRHATQRATVRIQILGARGAHALNAIVARGHRRRRCRGRRPAIERQ